MRASINVLGTPLAPCSHAPPTGWYRDGSCNTDDDDRGSHTVAAQVTEDFLIYLQAQGNDLITPVPQHGFRGLRPGDRWCVCAGSWYRAFLAGMACPIDLQATHASALDIVPLEALMQCAAGGGEA